MKNNQKLLLYEDKNKKNGAQQKLRGKELNTVLDTGEKAEVYKQFLELNTEMNLYTKRYEKLQNLNEKTAQSFKDITDKLVGFTKEYDKIKDREPFIEDVTDKEIINQSHLKAKKQLNAINGKYDSKTRACELKIKKLEEELASIKENEVKLNQDIENHKEKYKAFQLTLNDLQLKNAAQNNKRLYNQASYSDDLMFITER